ncbi:TRAP transporter substrate-binding protein DctP [Noviherbaspirillum saxi]|uniref:TRAP-type C4-dicarboxylate transport system, substrate-binding protein n=1 Tax=Noviherbaspirillum saxi TaxID=2320863 RepID=A0A3A3FWS8_9BURK|nr:TRAP transporter substrate-binding protein DctP [Noviherbaspirillum saxi]RJF98631.1 hypothetical protein D3871_09005 [Noviherbaspirillum saxi]
MHRIIKSLLITAALVAAGTATAQTKIAFGGAMPTNEANSRANVQFFKRVETQTNGQLKFDASFDGQVVNYRSTLGSIKDGLVDAGQLFPAFFFSELKTLSLFLQLGPQPLDPWSGAAAMNEMVLLNCPECDAELSRYKIKGLSFSGSAPFYTILRNPINDIGELKGKLIRGIGPSQVFIQQLGANPAATAPSEIFEAMQRGQIEGAIAGVDWLKQYGLADVAKFVVEQPTGHDFAGRMPFVASTELWKKLSAEQKQVISRNLPFLVAEATANSVADGQEARRFAESKGVKFSPVRGYSDKVAAFRSAEIERIVSSYKKQGVERADVLVKTYLEKLAKWEKIVAETKGDRKAYEEALWSEIFSKLK